MWTALLVETLTLCLKVFFTHLLIFCYWSF